MSYIANANNVTSRTLSPSGRTGVSAGIRLRVGAVGALLILATLVSCNPAKDAIGSVLEPIKQKVNDILVEAGTQGQILLVTAASQVDLAVSNAESAFAGDLEKSINQADDATRATIDHLRTLADSLTSDSSSILTSAIDGSQQLINSIPFTNKNPQVRSYSPQIVAIKGDSVQVTVEGNFYWAMETSKAVSLKIGDATYSANENTTNRVGFSIPSSVFSAASDSFARVSLELTAPYETGIIFKDLQPGVFHLLVTTLPTKPLRALTLTDTVSTIGTETKTVNQPAEFDINGSGWRVQSWDTCDEQKDSHTVSPDAGYSISPSSATVNYIARGVASRGSATITTNGPTGFVVEGHTWPNCTWGISSDSGDITYYVSFIEERQIETTKNETIDLFAAPHNGLSWGDQAVIPIASGQWMLHAELWDGTTLETNGDDVSNPYLKIYDDRTSVKISLLAPASLL